MERTSRESSFNGGLIWGDTELVQATYLHITLKNVSQLSLERAVRYFWDHVEYQDFKVF